MMYTAINDSFYLFDESATDTTKMMVILSDGNTDDTGMHSSVSTTAQANGIKLYTVGLGSTTSYFDNYLKPLASETDAQYYHSADADQLSSIYTNIQIHIDLMTDSDGDKLIDHYEKNPVSFDGNTYECDPTIADTDGDGLLDGEEVVVIKILSWGLDENGNVVIGEKMAVVGRVFSYPMMKDSDSDGVEDRYDLFPMNPDLS